MNTEIEYSLLLPNASSSHRQDSSSDLYKKASSGSANSASSGKFPNSSYESLRRDMISILGQQMKMPSASGNEVDSNLGLSHANSGSNPCATSSNTTTKDNFDSYFSKLQTICTDSSMEEGKEGKLSHQQQQQQQQLGVSCSTASSAFSGSGMGSLLPLGTGNTMPPPPIPQSMMPTSI